MAAIGPGTAAALREHGLIADIVPERFVAEGLVEALAGVPVTRALVARAAEARDVLPDALRRGAEVDVVALYETVAEPLRAPARGGGHRDYVTFTSSSREVPLRGDGRGLSARHRLVSIGPVTSQALRDRGREPDVEAPRHDIDGLVAALLEDARLDGHPRSRGSMRHATQRVGRGISFGAPHRHYRVTDSTNTRARELAEARRPARHGASPPPSRPRDAGARGAAGPRRPAGRCSTRRSCARSTSATCCCRSPSPLAVCEAAEELRPGIECAIKWPNDVWLEGRKLAGVLIEARPQDGWAVIGVGLNLSIAPDEFPPELRDTAISLFDSVRRVGDGSPEPPRCCSADPSTTLLDRSRSLDHHLDRWVAAAGGRSSPSGGRATRCVDGRSAGTDGSGVADGVDETGRLVVVVSGGERVALGAGEVHLSL